jgi:hypothetical protein
MADTTETITMAVEVVITYDRPDARESVIRNLKNDLYAEHCGGGTCGHYSAKSGRVWLIDGAGGE